MIIEVTVHTRASRRLVEQKKGDYHVYVHAPPEKGRANKEVIELIAGHFGVSKTSIKILRGVKSKKKTLEISV